MLCRFQDSARELTVQKLDAASETNAALNEQPPVSRSNAARAYFGYKVVKTKDI